MAWATDKQASKQTWALYNRELFTSCKKSCVALDLLIMSFAAPVIWEHRIRVRAGWLQSAAVTSIRCMGPNSWRRAHLAKEAPVWPSAELLLVLEHRIVVLGQNVSTLGHWLIVRHGAQDRHEEPLALYLSCRHHTQQQSSQHEG